MSFEFDLSKHPYSVKTSEACGVLVTYRAFENITYVQNPSDPEHHLMNIYVPEAYYFPNIPYKYTLDSAPILFAINIGGYRPCGPAVPGPFMANPMNASFMALTRGFIVVAPAARGIGLKDENGKNYGTAPAAIVDLKAAVRFLRAAKNIPGNKDAIISNGTSAGGALSALLASSGNHPDFEPYLSAIGACYGRDDILAASCYCPITNLENADMAYEWLFDDVWKYHYMKFKKTADGVERIPMDGTLDEKHREWSKTISCKFPEYLNSLDLIAEDGSDLELSDDGTGSFAEYLKGFLGASASKAISEGRDLSGIDWFTVKDGKITDIDLKKHSENVTRMKPVPAFDEWDLSDRNTPETELFGTADIDHLHFSSASSGMFTDEHMTDPKRVRMMNAMNFIGSPDCTTAKFWRIRHGEADRDTSLAIPLILFTVLKNKGYSADLFFPYGIPHTGDYDLEELFGWIENTVLSANS